jgi:hypothetical protein
LRKSEKNFKKTLASLKAILYNKIRTYVLHPGRES